MDPKDAAEAALGDDMEIPETTAPDESGGSDGANGSSGPAGRAWDLLNTSEPDVSPSQASGAFDVDEPWHSHVEVAVAKISNAGGIPAWLNLVIAVALYAKQAGSDAVESSDDDQDEVPKGLPTA